jgi:hypothetical protein
MAYVPGFDWDIFISYPHETDARDANELEWVNEFYRILDKELNERLPEPPKIYFDRRQFAASHSLESELLEAARHSALFVPIVSPRYVAPGKFTLRELAAFCGSGDVAKRIVTIELLPVNHEEGRPEALQGPKRNNFFVREEGRPIKLTPRSERYGDLFATRLQIVAEDVKDALQEMRRNAGAAVQAGKKPFAGTTVLLAEREENVVTEWEDVRGMLRDFGAVVLPAEGYAADDADFACALNADIETAKLFVQLLSPADEANHWIEGRPSRARLQCQAAMKFTRPILQWRKPLAVRPEALKHWDKELMEGPNVITLGLEEFKREIKKKLVEITAPQKPQPTRAATKPYVYITADDPDLDYALQFKEAAESQLKLSDCDIIAATDRRTNFEEAIKITDIMVFLYGAGNPEFVDNWLRQYAKLKANGLAKPPEVEALYRAPPPKSDSGHKLRGPLGSFISLGSEELFTLEGIEQVFEELKRRRSSGAAAP